MIFLEVLEANPKAAEVMFKYGLHCIGCHAARFETIEQGGKAHGLTDAQIKKMIEEMNKDGKNK